MNFLKTYRSKALFIKTHKLKLADADLLVATRTATEEALRMALRYGAPRSPPGTPTRTASSAPVRLVAKVRRHSLSSSLLNLARLLDGPTPPPAGNRRGELLRAWH